MGYETGSLFAHIADEAHEHLPSGEIAWHHMPHIPAMDAGEPMLVVGVVAMLLLAAVAFAVHRWRAGRLRSVSA